MSERPVDAIERILGETEDADDVLRVAVAALVSDPDIAWAGVSFLDDGVLVLGPEAGSPDETRRVCVPITFKDALVGELCVDGMPGPRARRARRLARGTPGPRGLGYGRRRMGAVGLRAAPSCADVCGRADVLDVGDQESAPAGS